MSETAVNLWLFLILCPGIAMAQEREQVFFIEDNRILFRIDLMLSMNEFDSLMKAYGMPAVTMDSLLQLNKINKEISGWRVRLINDNILELYKPLHDLSGSMDPETPVSFTQEGRLNFNYAALNVAYGVNNFKRTSVFDFEKNKGTVFLLRNYEEANSVFLSGSFNGWSLTQNSMTQTDSGWAASVSLKPGKHHYKFIVDGKWIDDPDNRLRDRNEVGTYNSVYYKYNYAFRLRGFSQAKKAVVAGSFNGWNTRELSMQKSAEEWRLPLYLREGTHAYKFIVDNEWIADPANAVTRQDGAGNLNSLIGLGDTIVFELRDYKNAHNVFLSGDFNVWNPGELQMERSSAGWRLPYVFTAGNYLYKFIVDGQWMPDPDNPHTQGSGDYVNSVLTVSPNHTFILSGYEQATVVRLSGSLNAWDTQGYTFAKKEGEWRLDLHLKPGKYTYKFIVDGEFILDPGNPYWEQNEYGTGNSVLWIEP